MNVEQYLRRIGMTNNISNDLTTLSKLQKQHMISVPFENLDVMNNVPIPLNIESYYEKIVINIRGGFCYELNGLFNWLLQNLGYKTTLVAASVKRSDGTWSMDTSHACLLVHFDVSYLVDVGFGDSVRTPLPLTGEMKHDVSGLYRMKKLDEKIYDLQRKDDEWNTLFRLNTTERQLLDFKEACHFNQTSPQSIFTQKELVSLATNDGRITLSNNRLIVTNKDDRKEREITESEKKTILKNYFNIT